MRWHLKNHRQLGLTFVELLIILAVVCLLCALLYPPARGCKGKAPRIACVNNLKQVALSELVWANDRSSEELPAQLSTNSGGLRELLVEGGLARYYQSLSNELTSPRILACPSDSRKPTDDFAALTTNHLSYFLNLDAILGTNFSAVFHGDRQIEFTPPRRGPSITLSNGTDIRWAKGIHSKDDQGGNAASVDGSVQSVASRADVEEVFRVARQGGHRFVFP